MPLRRARAEVSTRTLSPPPCLPDSAFGVRHRCRFGSLLDRRPGGASRRRTTDEWPASARGGRCRADWGETWWCATGPRCPGLPSGSDDSAASICAEFQPTHRARRLTARDLRFRVFGPRSGSGSNARLDSTTASLAERFDMGELMGHVSHDHFSLLIIWAFRRLWAGRFLPSARATAGPAWLAANGRAATDVGAVARGCSRRPLSRGRKPTSMVATPRPVACQG